MVNSHAPAPHPVPVSPAVSPSVLPRWPSARAAAAGLRSPEERAVLGRSRGPTDGLC